MKVIRFQLIFFKYYFLKKISIFIVFYTGLPDINSTYFWIRRFQSKLFYKTYRLSPSRLTVHGQLLTKPEGALEHRSQSPHRDHIFIPNVYRRESGFWVLSFHEVLSSGNQLQVKEVRKQTSN